MPDLGDLDKDENIKHTVDFRAVYSKLVDEWFADEPGVIGRTGWSSPVAVPDLIN